MDQVDERDVPSEVREAGRRLRDALGQAIQDEGESAVEEMQDAVTATASRSAGATVSACIRLTCKAMQNGVKDAVNGRLSLRSQTPPPAAILAALKRWQPAGRNDEVDDTLVVEFIARVKAVADMCQLRAELAHVLGQRHPHQQQQQQQSDEPDSEQKTEGDVESGTVDVFSASASAWKRAVEAELEALSPQEEEAADKLGANLALLKDKPQALARSLSRYEQLLKRPVVQHLLSGLYGQIEALLGQVTDLIDSAHAEDARHGSGGKNLSSEVSTLVWLQQLQGRVLSVEEVLGALPSHADQRDALLQQCRELSENAKHRIDDTFREWKSRVQDQLEDERLGLEMQGQLMSIDSEGILQVNYSERLVILLREVRQLRELGFPRRDIPEQILRAEDRGNRFYRYAVLLKNIANFYNSLAHRVLPHQKHMMRLSLMRFDELVNPQSAGARGAADSYITWEDSSKCESYVQRLQNAADMLASENRRLRQINARVCKGVVALVSIDLLRQKEDWLKRFQDVKGIVEAVRSKYKREDMRIWVRHWDNQLYKVLELGYRTGLETLNENLQEMSCDLVFAHRRLQFKPALEEMRSSYYREMKKFINIPNAFAPFGDPAIGLDDNSAVFRRMAVANSRRLVHLYDQAETLFASLARLRKQYEPWAVLGQVSDLDGFIDEHVAELSEYEMNFKLVKARRKQSEKIPDFEKVDCIRVSLVPFKMFVEQSLDRLHEGLLASLRRKLLNDFKVVDTFLEESMEKLSTVPSTVEDIGRARATWDEIKAATTDMLQQSHSCVQRKTLLLQHAPGRAVDTSEVVSRMANLDGEGGRWDEFNIALQAFNSMVEDQKEQLKGQLEEEVDKMTETIHSFEQHWKTLKPQEMKSWDDESVQQVFDALDDWAAKFEEKKKSADELANNCVLFGMHRPRFEVIEQIAEELEHTQSLWEMLRTYRTEKAEFAGRDWISFRSNVHALQDWAVQWTKTVRDRIAASPQDVVVTDHMMGALESIKKAMRTLEYCRGDPFKEEHWSALLQGKMGLPRTVRLENLVVGHFLQCLEVLAEASTLQFVKHLHARAQGEVTIREALQELIAWSQTAELKLIEHEEAGRKTALIREWKDLFSELGDKQSLLASLKESPFFRPFEDQGVMYEAKLGLLDGALHTLNAIQRKWVYLEPIFGRGSLPSEQARFRRVDEEFRDIMERVEAEPQLFNLADDHLFPNLSDSLNTMLDQLERCQKALSDFLEKKRSAMPRFYFLGDDDLLEILGQAKNPPVIQTHLKKLFQGIHRVEFSGKPAKFADDDEELKSGDVDSSGSMKIVAMISSAGERVALKKPVPVTDDVEMWLETLSHEMKHTLSTLLEQCFSEGPSFDDYPSQVLCLSELIRFTADAEAAIRSGTLQDLRDSCTEVLSTYTGADLSSQPLTQLKVKALVLDLVHNMDVIDLLIKNDVRSTSDWLWQKQLRFYLNSGAAAAANGDPTNVGIRMCDAQFVYSFEYQGNAPKLVHTPLTDKCYLTLTQGMHMGFGGNPYGPAGTGKTESVKALGQAFGRQVLVFNCDEGIDFRSMGRIFIGLIKCGAWGCFDEFNRLKEDQLSAISQQIQVIQDAIKQRQSSVNLLGRTINVDFNAGIFVTLNPAGKDYGGRSRLPDNLKALFRPVAMGRPDNELIAEVILYSEGFRQAKDLAAKIVSLFTLSKQLLSHQRHYDWGLRALKAVLNTGGKLVRQYIADGVRLTSDLEREVLIKAVRVNTLSKLTFVDTQRFLDLIGDVFPGAESTDISGGDLEAAIRKVMVAKPFNLVADDMQVKKMLQLKEAIDQRMGCVIVGPSGCGKSTVWQVLRAAMRECGQPVVTHVMNPKSMPRQRLLGHMDLDTREWTDGVLTDAARKVVLEPAEVRAWIVCDGDVDPEWIESLNSVLDDNHLLTLPNGERISFGDNVNFIFETHDLRFASPATVSRMGMIFLSDEDVDVSKMLEKWLSEQEEERRMSLRSWIDELFMPSLQTAMDYDEVVSTTLMGTVLNGLSQVSNVETRSDFIAGLARGLAANVSVADRAALTQQIYELAREPPPKDTDTVGSLRALSSRTSSMMGDDRGGPGGAGAGAGGAGTGDDDGITIVSTVSIQRTVTMLQPWIDASAPFILVGPAGCGKSLVIREAFQQHRNISISMLHCNAQTTAEHVISKIAQTCSLFSSNEGRVYRPRDCERLVLFLKDINLPKPDMYDTCMLIAFLQQLLTFGGFYDESLEFLRLERVQIVASMNAASTVGRHALSTRFTAAVRIAVMDYPDTNELVTIYDSQLGVVLDAAEAHFGQLEGRWAPEDRKKLAQSLVQIYSSLREKFSVDDHRHYTFTPRDITTWVTSFLRYDLRSESLLDVFAYEARRIFRDRLVGHDTSRFDTMLNDVLRTKWRHKCEDGLLYSTLAEGFGGAGSGARAGAGGGKEADDEGKDGGESKGNGSGVAAGGAGRATDGSKLLLRMSLDDLDTAVKQGLVYYQREEKELRTLFFGEMLEHASHVERVLSRPSSHLLLIGRSGVGGPDVATLIAYLLGHKFVTPAVARNFGLPQFQAELKACMQTAGVADEAVVLFIEDYQLTTPTILETINSVLSAGEVPGLYTHEELEPLLAPLKEEMREEGQGMYRTPYDFFVARVRRNLRIVLNLDPTDPLFLMRCEANPALFSRCTVLWMGEWRSTSLRSIPRMLLGADYEQLVGDDEQREELLLDKIVQIHESCRSHADIAATPLDFMSLLQSWSHMHEDKKSELQGELSRLEKGLSKLLDAAQTVNELSEEATTQAASLKEAQVAADAAMTEITRALEEATDRKKLVQDLRVELAEHEEQTQRRKDVIESELAQITPILQQAKKAVGGIEPRDLNEIRSMATPPKPLQDVLGAVLMLLGLDDISWDRIKQFLRKQHVKDDILNFDARRITPELRQKVSKYVRSVSSSFDNIQRTSVAAAPLATWLRANIKYSEVLETIRPLQRDLADATAALERSQQRLQQCEDELREIDERVEAMRDQFARKTAEAEKLKVGLERVQTTLSKAQHLLDQLSGEKDRWEMQTKVFNRQLERLPLHMLFAAGFAVYLAKTPENVRGAMMREWNSHGLSDAAALGGESKGGGVGDEEESKGGGGGRGGGDALQFKRLMSTESQLLAWKAKGLPSDDLSQENGLVITHTADRVPFIIDPANAATDWLRAVLQEDPTRPLEVVTAADPRLTNQVELAVRFGKTLVILEVDGVEPFLFPLARKDLRVQGPRHTVQVGEKVLDYNENFRMFLVTRNPEPDIPPNAAAVVVQVNFTVTRSGLEGQLLGVTIQHEEPELEKAKGETLKHEEEFKIQLAGFEADLLEALASAEGNLLDNTALIDTLSRTKEKAAEIEHALERSAEAGHKLDQQREVYRPFAECGSKLFFLMKDMAAVDHMYQFSLSSFIDLFRSTLSADMSSRDLQDRLQKLAPSLQVRVLYFVGQALFKVHRPVFALQLIHGMREDMFADKEWEVFTGQLVASVGSDDSVVEGFPHWADKSRQSSFAALCEHLPHLVRTLQLTDTSLWHDFERSTECELEFPSIRGVSPFQRLLLVQALRPDRLQSAIDKFCCDTLNVNSVSPRPPTLADLHESTTARLPVLLVTSTGADPSKELQDFAAKTVGVDRYQELAMGGGQQEVALTMLRAAADSGDWLCLKNVHLVVTWLPILEKELNTLAPHPEFRIWLTTEPHASFSAILLQQSLKVTFESPPGIKKNVQRTLSNWDQSFLDRGSVLRAQLLFVLAYFHAIVQERRTYMPQGWSKFYEFSNGDLRAGSEVMSTAAVSDSPDWVTIQNLMEDAVYGGRVDNRFDGLVLMTYLRQFFTEDTLREQRVGHQLRLPDSKDYHSYMDVVEGLPDHDEPEAFGLPSNIGRSVQRTLGTKVINDLRLIGASALESAKFDREHWRATLKPILELWSESTRSMSKPDARAARRSSRSAGRRMAGGEEGKHGGGGGGGSGGAMSAADPVETFVQMEDAVATDLVAEVDMSLTALKRVISGASLLTPDIQELAGALMAGNVPAQWSAVWDGPSNPLVWLAELVRRKKEINHWLSWSARHELLDQELVLGDVFHPGTFMNALRQQTARKLRCSMEELRLVSVWEQQNFASASLPVRVSGLRLQGAQLNATGVLSPAKSSGAELEPVPVVTIAYIPSNEPSIMDSQRTLNVPVYFDSSRTQLLCDLAVPIPEPPRGARLHVDDPDDQSRWILAGVALFLGSS